MTMSSVTTRKYTVEEVYSPVYCLYHVFRRTDSHKIGRLLLRKKGNYLVQNPVHILMALPDRKTSYSVARKLQFGNLFCMVNSHIGKDSSLINAEEKLILVDCALLFIQFFHPLLTTNKPACRPLHRGLDILPVRKCRRALIKGHGNGGSKIGLNFHRLFRSHENPPPVNMGAKLYTLFPNLSSGLCQAVDLKTAGIGENRLIPIHQLMQPPKRLDYLVSCSDMKVIGIGQLHLRSD